MSDGWQPIETAPRDGTPFFVELPARKVRVFWCNDLKGWITDREYRINRVHNPQRWKPERGTPPPPSEGTGQ